METLTARLPAALPPGTPRAIVKVAVLLSLLKRGLEYMGREELRQYIVPLQRLGKELNEVGGGGGGGGGPVRAGSWRRGRHRWQGQRGTPRAPAASAAQLPAAR